MSLRCLVLIFGLFVGFAQAESSTQNSNPLLLIPLLIPSKVPLKISGQVFEKGTRTPLAGIRIYLLPYQLKAVSNNQGEFVFEQAPLGDCEWIIHEAGFLPFKKTDSILSGEKSATPDNEVKRIFFIEKNSYGAFETTVYGKLDRQDDSVKSLTSDQFENLPGSGGDPIRAIENLPGMARSSNRSNAIIEGSSPKDTRYTVDGHEIPLSFHLLVNTSVIMPDAVYRVD